MRSHPFARAGFHYLDKQKVRGHETARFYYDSAEMR